MSQIDPAEAPPFQVRLDPPSTKFARERAAFFRLLPQLLTTHRGQYVAIHEERPVESGAERLEVAMRVLSRVGNADIFVGLVTDEPESAARSGVRRDLSARGPGR
jgi:hypothetical protein